jgi:hypothetical protein
MIKATFTNEEFEIAVNVVSLNDGRFSVTMKDLESGETLPVARIFPPSSYEKAMDYAKEIVGQQGSLDWVTL